MATTKKLIQELQAKIKVAYMAGFDAGAEDNVDSGLIIDAAFKIEVTEAAYDEWLKTQ